MITLASLNKKSELKNRELHTIKGGESAGGSVHVPGSCSCACGICNALCEKKSADHKYCGTQK